MKNLLRPLILTGLCGLVASCSDTPSAAEYNPERGPFDADGNYVEAWADNPPTAAERRAATKRKDKDADRIAKWEQKETGRTTTTTTARVDAPVKKKSSATASTTVKKKPAVKKKPKPQVVKPKVKPPIRHTVKKGDTLYGLSRKYGTTVSRIQKANGLSGTTIRLGQTLTIPR